MVDARPSIAIVLPWMPPSHVRVPRTTSAPGVSCCWPDVTRRHCVGDDGGDVDLDLAAGRLLPEEAVGAGAGLAQLEEARARLVRADAAHRNGHQRRGREHAHAPAHFAVLPSASEARTRHPATPSSARSRRDSAAACPRTSRPAAASGARRGSRVRPAAARRRARAPRLSVVLGRGRRGRRSPNGRDLPTDPARPRGSRSRTRRRTAARPRCAKSAPRLRQHQRVAEAVDRRVRTRGGQAAPRAAAASASTASPRRSGLRYTWRKDTVGSAAVRGGVRVEPRLQLGIGRRHRVDGVLCRELELLPEPAPDDRVVAVEPRAIASRVAISSRT